MKESTLISRLDSMASSLEAVGKAHLAAELDMVSNTLEAHAGIKDWFASAKNQIKAMLGNKLLSPEEALATLREHGIHHIDDKLMGSVLQPEALGVKEAGLGDFLKGVLNNPVKVALLSLALAANSANAADINKMVNYMAMPSSTQVSLLESGVAPLWVFRSQFKGMVEDNLDKDTPLGKYLHERMKEGETKDQLVQQLLVAFQRKLADPKNKDTLEKLNKYLKSKDVSDTTSFLEPLVQEVAKSSL